VAASNLHRIWGESTSPSNTDKANFFIPLVEVSKQKEELRENGIDWNGNHKV
jgi:hypothetical protein